MFWYGVIIGALVMNLLTMVLFLGKLIRHNISECEFYDIMRLIKKAGRRKSVVVEIWQDYDDHSGNADLVGQVFLENK